MKNSLAASSAVERYIQIDDKDKLQRRECFLALCESLSETQSEHQASLLLVSRQEFMISLLEGDISWLERIITLISDLDIPLGYSFQLLQNAKPLTPSLLAQALEQVIFEQMNTCESELAEGDSDSLTERSFGQELFATRSEHLALACLRNSRVAIPAVALSHLQLFPIERQLHQVLLTQNHPEMRRLIRVLLDNDSFLATTHPKVLVIRISLLIEVSSQLKNEEVRYLKKCCQEVHRRLNFSDLSISFLTWADLLAADYALFSPEFASWCSARPESFRQCYASELRVLQPIPLRKTTASSQKIPLAAPAALQGLSRELTESLERLLDDKWGVQELQIAHVRKSSNRGLDIVDAVHPWLGQILESADVLGLRYLLRLCEICSAAALARDFDAKTFKTSTEEKALQILHGLNYKAGIPFPPHVASYFVRAQEQCVLELSEINSDETPGCEEFFDLTYQAKAVRGSTAEAQVMYDDQMQFERESRGISAFNSATSTMLDMFPEWLFRCLDDNVGDVNKLKFPESWKKRYAFILRSYLVQFPKLTKDSLQTATDLVKTPYKVDKNKNEKFVVLFLLGRLKVRVQDYWLDQHVELNTGVLALLQQIEQRIQLVSTAIHDIFVFEEKKYLPITWNDLISADSERWLPIFCENYQRPNELYKQYFVTDYARMLMEVFDELEKQHEFTSVPESKFKTYQTIIDLAVDLSQYDWHDKLSFVIWLYAKFSVYEVPIYKLNYSVGYVLMHLLPLQLTRGLKRISETQIVAIAELVIHAIAENLALHSVDELLSALETKDQMPEYGFKVKALAKFLKAFRYCQADHERMQDQEELIKAGFSEISTIPETLILQVLDHLQSEDNEYFQALLGAYVRRIVNLPNLQLQKRMHYLIDTLDFDKQKLLSETGMGKEKRKKLARILGITIDVSTQVQQPVVKKTLDIIQELNRLLERYPLKRRTPATWCSEQKVTILKIEVQLDWLLEIYHQCGLVLEKLAVKPHGCFAGFSLQNPAQVDDMLLKKIEEQLQACQQEHKQKKSQAKPEKAALPRAPEGKPKTSNKSQFFASGTSAANVMRLASRPAKSAVQSSEKKKGPSRSAKGKPKLQLHQKPTTRTIHPAKQAETFSTIDPLSPPSPLDKAIRKLMQEHVQKLPDDTPVNAKRALTFQDEPEPATIARPPALVGLPQYSKQAITDRYLLPSLEFLLTQLINPKITGTAARYFMLRIAILVSAADSDSLICRWSLFSNTFLSGRQSRHTVVHAYFPRYDAAPPSYLQTELFSHILELLKTRNTAAKTQLMLKLDQNVIEERSRYPLTIHINEYLHEMVDYLLTPPDTASALFVANRIGEVLTLVQYFSSYHLIKENAAVSAFIKLRNDTTHYAEYDKDGCHEELLMTTQMGALLWHMRGLKEFLSAIRFNPQYLIDTEYCYTAENINELLRLTLQHDLVGLAPLITFADLKDLDLDKQHLLVPIALAEGHYAALGIKLESQQCFYVSCHSGDIPAQIKRFVRSHKLDLISCDALLTEKPADRAPLLIAAVQQLQERMLKNTSTPLTVDTLALRGTHNALSPSLFQQQLLSHRANRKIGEDKKPEYSRGNG